MKQADGLLNPHLNDQIFPGHEGGSLIRRHAQSDEAEIDLPNDVGRDASGSSSSHQANAYLWRNVLSMQSWVYKYYNPHFDHSTVPPNSLLEVEFRIRVTQEPLLIEKIDQISTVVQDPQFVDPQSSHHLALLVQQLSPNDEQRSNREPRLHNIHIYSERGAIGDSFQARDLMRDTTIPLEGAIVRAAAALKVICRQTLHFDHVQMARKIHVAHSPIRFTFMASGQCNLEYIAVEQDGRVVVRFIRRRSTMSS